jgi:ABC-type oligopeptide transport system substrate-binding subunit
MTEYLELQRAGVGDLMVGRWNSDHPDADNFVYTLLHSEAGFLGRYIGGPDVDELAERGRAETDPRIRNSIYTRVEELIAREALMLPLFYDQVYCFARPEVMGLVSVSQGNPIVDYEDLWIRR